MIKELPPIPALFKKAAKIKGIKVKPFCECFCFEKRLLHHNEPSFGR